MALHEWFIWNVEIYFLKVDGSYEVTGFIFSEKTIKKKKKKKLENVIIISFEWFFNPM